MTSSLGVRPDFLLKDFHTFGCIFENLCIRDVTAYASSSGGRIPYDTDRSHLEVDAVLHLDDGRYALIEFTLGNYSIAEGAAHLLEVAHLIWKATQLPKGRALSEPEAFIIIPGGEIAYTRVDGISGRFGYHVFPAHLRGSAPLRLKTGTEGGPVRHGKRIDGRVNQRKKSCDIRRERGWCECGATS